MDTGGLRLKSEQVQGLCGIDDDACRAVLETLVVVGFVLVHGDGSYLRSKDGDTSRLRSAKATLDSEPNTAMARLRRRAG